MAWIESHQALGRHPKMIRLAARVRACRPQVIGHLHYLWWWALDFAPDGDLSGLSSVEVAAASEWNGDADLWLAALKECRWIDDDNKLHDWLEYAGKLVEQRARDRERKRNVRRTSDGIPPDIVRTADVPNRTNPTNRTEGAGTPLPPIPVTGPASAVADPPPKRQGQPEEKPETLTNKPKIAMALAYFADPENYPDERFQAEEVRQAFGEFNAGQQDGFWMWGKRRVGDWRDAMASRMRSNRERRGGKKPATNAGDALIRGIKAVKV